MCLAPDARDTPRRKTRCMHVARHPQLHRPSPRTAAIALDLILGLSAVLGMVYALAGADGVDREWLTDTPFHDYVVPGLILGIVVGGALMTSAAALWLRVRGADLATAGAGLALIAWILIQVWVIGAVSVLQPIVLLGGVALFALALRIDDR